MAAAKGPGFVPAVCSLERDWPLCSDGWMKGFFDGNPNLVRERETRLILAMADDAVLRLDSFPFAAVEVEAFPIDRGNNTFFPVAEALRGQGPRAVFGAEQVAALREAAALKPQGPPARAAAGSDPSGARALTLPVRLPANGALFLDLRKAR